MDKYFQSKNIHPKGKKKLEAWHSSIPLNLGKNENITFLTERGPNALWLYIIKDPFTLQLYQ